MKPSVLASPLSSSMQGDASAASSRAVVYSFIANFLSTAVPVPGGAYVTAIAESFRGSLERVDESACAPDTWRVLKAASRLVDLDAEREQLLLATDRTKLVLGLETGNPVKPPFESLYLTSNDSLDEIANIAGFYRKAGYELRAAGENRPDAFATECRFMTMLCQEHGEASRSNDRHRVCMLEETQSIFLNHHLGAWAPEYCGKAADHARSLVFEGVMLFAGGFIREEKEAWA